MTGLEITLIISTSIFTITSILMTVFYISMKKRYKIVDEGHRDDISNRNYWRRRFNELNSDIESDKEQFLSQFETQLSIGDMFSVPDTRHWKDEFRNTTQKITSIDFEGGGFTSVNARTGRGPHGHDAWSNRFTQIKDFTWVNQQNRLKHKFIK